MEQVFYTELHVDGLRDQQLNWTYFEALGDDFSRGARTCKETCPGYPMNPIKRRPLSQIVQQRIHFIFLVFQNMHVNSQEDHLVGLLLSLFT